MEVKASLNNLRVAPRKVRLVAGVINGLPVGEAKTQLKFLVKKSSRPILKLLESAQSNAEHNFGLDKNNLFVKSILVNEGRPLKRWLPRAFGRATPILKRTSHINIILQELEPGKNRKVALVKQSKQEPAKPQVERPGVSDIEEESIAKKRQEFKSVQNKEKKSFFSTQKLKNVGRFFRRKSV